MKALRIKGTEDNLDVIFDTNPEAPVFIISGSSYPVDSVSFYSQLFKWLDEYAKFPLDKTVIDLKIKYLNTSSSILLLDLLLKLEDIYLEGNDVLIRWHILNNDQEAKKTVLDYSSIVDVPYVTIQENN